LACQPVHDGAMSFYLLAALGTHLVLFALPPLSRHQAW
jgi:hypothetical protein